ncbi:MAG: general secretion pathway protein GspK [Bdellovibrionaceae bacterium]|nr:general secretion pathway protein GspK [Pseudobdellovibrionaceae bacterium]MDW8190802.1 type II secretion system protein GspK [Pseudobdellovibrionaceae bacterium]
MRHEGPTADKKITITHLKAQRGIAILASIFIILLLVFIATEVSYETSMEYIVHAQSPHHIQAYYNARSGIELARLRLAIYQLIQQRFGEQLKNQQALLNKIWSLPFIWPPPILADLPSHEVTELEELRKNTTIPGSFETIITDEGSKIDINDLGSPSITIREITKKLLIEILENQATQDPEFRQKMDQMTAEEIVGNLQDWIDTDSQSVMGGVEPQDAFNRWLRFPEEVFEIQTIPFEIRLYLSKIVTVFGQKAFNPNTASRELLSALDPSITEKVVNEIIKRRENPQLGGPFSAVDEFWNFVNFHGARVTPEKQGEIPLIFDQVSAFRITSVGKYKQSVKTLEVIVWDFDYLVTLVSRQILKEIDESPSKSKPIQSKVQRTSDNKDNYLLPIVYWVEK